jgi:replicative superfamily II helicase
MLVSASTPDFSSSKISNFPYENAFKHQYEFYEKRRSDIILKSPTSSGKTDAFLFGFINDYLDAKSKGKRLKTLYLVPTHLLMYSQLENITSHLEKFKVPYKILESGYTYAQLFNLFLY